MLAVEPLKLPLLNVTRARWHDGSTATGLGGWPKKGEKAKLKKGTEPSPFWGIRHLFGVSVTFLGVFSSSSPL
jgi:hypothetical protein